MIKETFLLSGINLSGKVLGLIKVVILASIYGAGSIYDGYIIAYTLPTTLPQILTIIISTIFIPQFHKKDRTTKSSWGGLNTILTLIVFISLSTTVILYTFSEHVVSFLAPGISKETNIIAIELFRMMSISTFLIGVSSFFISLSYARNKFFLASLDSLIINTLVITYCFIYGVKSDISSIVILIVIGFLLNFLILTYSNRDYLFRYIRLGLDYRHDDFVSPLKKSLPIIIGYVGAITTSIVDQWFASYEQIGAISILAYASMLFLLPMEVFGKAVMDTYFTRFSQLSNERDALLRSYHEGMGLIFFILIPVSLFLLLSNTEIIRVIFERGEFSSSDTHLTSLVLSALSLGLVLRAVTYFNYRLLHAIEKSWLAISVGLIGVVINIIFNYILAKHLGLVGIALATTISILSSVILSCVLLKKFYDIQYYKYVTCNLIKIISISLLSIFLYAYIIEKIDCAIGGTCFFIFNFAMLFFITVVFFVAGYVFNVNEVRTLVEYVKHRRNA